MFRSKTRTALERFRQQFTMKRPYRCHAGNWRGWAPDDTQAVAPGDVLDAPSEPPNLTAIDQARADSSEDRSQKGQLTFVRSKQSEGPTHAFQKPEDDRPAERAFLLASGFLFLASGF